MMRSLLALLFAGIVAAHAQQVGQNASPRPGSVPTISVSAQLVIETVSVKDKNGKPITGLTAKDFTLTENGVPQTIHFCEHQDLPAEAPVTPAAQPVAGNLTRPRLGKNLVQQTCGNFRLRRKKLEPLPASLRLFKQRSAGRADGHVRRENSFVFGPQQSVEGIGQKGLPVSAFGRVRDVRALCHYITSRLLRSSRRASSARPRLMRDFTVPSGMPSTWAISL